MSLTNPHMDSDIGTLTIGGLDLTCAFSHATWNSTKQTTDVGGPCREGALNQTTGRQGTLSGSFYGASSNGFVTNYLDLSSITIGGVQFKPVLYTLDISGSFGKQKLPGFASGMAEGILKKNYSGSVELQLDDTDLVQTLVIAAESATNTDAQVQLVFIMNGVTISIPIQLNEVSHPIQTGDYQKITISFVSQAPARGTAFPTLPTALPGSPGLLDWALLTPRTNKAFSFVSKATHGLVRAGDLTYDSFTFKLSDGEITLFDYVFKTYGDWTTTNNGA